MYTFFWTTDKRFYRISVSQNLFNEFTIKKEWGSRFNHNGNLMNETFHSEEDMKIALRSTLIRRARRGYRLKDCFKE